jgi:hypothetical protein
MSSSKLRVIEPLRVYGHILAEVFVSSIGLPPALAMQFDTEDGGEASVTLTAREAHDLMLWLRCALDLPPQQDETAANHPAAQVAGDYLTTSLAQFIVRAQHLLIEEQEKPDQDNALVSFLCDAVRLARENGRLATAPLQVETKAESHYCIDCNEAHDPRSCGAVKAICEHEWKIDGAHSNEYCGKCYIPKPSGGTPAPRCPTRLQYTGGESRCVRDAGHGGNCLF